MNWKSIVVGLCLWGLVVLGSSAAVSAKAPGGEPEAELFVEGLAGGSGSTVGPGGDLYVTEGLAGRISRVDPWTGEVTTYATGLPQALIGIGGPMDVAFIGGTAYALVTLVGPDVGGNDVVGIYRIDGPESYTIIADIGAYSVAHPPATDFFVPSGVQYAIEAYRGDFLVTDGHHNRVLRVTRDGAISEVITFGNIVPTGLAIWGNQVLMTEAGPSPHHPEDGKVMAFSTKSDTVTEIASGARLLVDVEFGQGRQLYALSQGIWDGVAEGTPAFPYTGSLVKVNQDGTFTVIVDELNIPTSMEFIGNTAYVVGLTGEIWKIEGVSAPPFGEGH